MLMVTFNLLFGTVFWTLVDAASNPSFWTMVDAVSSATLALLAIAAAIYYGHHQVKWARQEAARRPVLEVAEMGLVHPSSVRQVRQALEGSYKGTVPDLILAVTLNDKGKDPALRIS